MFQTLAAGPNNLLAKWNRKTFLVGDQQTFTVREDALGQQILYCTIKLNIHIYIVPKFSIHKALYSCDMEAADAEAAQTETLKKLCAKDKCDIDPRAIFDTSSCPGMQLLQKLYFCIISLLLIEGKESEFALWVTYSCDGAGATDASSFDLEKGKH